MIKKKAKLVYKHNSFEILETGDYVIWLFQEKNNAKRFKLLECGTSEAYYSPVEVKESLKK